MNKVIISGRTTAEPTLKYSQAGKAICNFTLAVRRSFKNSQGEYESDFINCVAWGKQAEIIAEYVKKGQVLPISGRLQVRTYEKDGQRHWASEAVVEEFDFPERKTSQDTSNSSAYGTEVEDSSDIPF